jgi:galactokinase
VWIAVRPRVDLRVSVFSADFGEAETFALASLERGPTKWVEYVKGVAWALQEAGFALTGWDGVIAGDVPIGAGLSSSAALEMATARAFAAVSALVWDAPTMALLGQRAENEWVGMNCGIMDQMISAAGEAGHALLIDCRSLATEAVPLPPETVVVVLDTATRRGLVGSAYNERRAQCEEASRYLGAPALRDVTIAQFEARSSGLDSVAGQRARHVITENERTLQAAEAMRTGDAVTLGKLMNASHISMRDDFQISNEQLDVIVELSQAHEECFGARMTGGGFGGCAVALVDAGSAEVFAAVVGQQYEAATGLAPSLYLCEATAGANIVYSAP